MKKNGEFVGVDEKFIPEDEKYVNESILGDKEETKEKVNQYVKKGGEAAKKIGIAYLAMMFLPFIIFIIMAIVMFTTVWNVRNSATRTDYYFEQYQGTNDGWEVRRILDNVVTHNKTNN